ncbi:MAG: DUF1223 domain-containing protein [Alphaproteobacteria bacterium]|nr:DUF1223 domain-containing protein [Alphaproteobacteria bacterium]
MGYGSGMSLRAWLHMGLAAALAVGAGAPAASAAERALTVVELFTSQGCASCPPADEYLAKLADRGDILPLSLHVDYWDYIGWRDPFASSANTERQRQYQAFFNTRYIYTPQMVVQGRYQAIGSKREDVAARIAEAARLPRLPVTLVRTDGAFAVRIDAAAAGVPAPGDAAVWLVLFDDRHETAVKKGENYGRTIVNRNVVRRFDLVGTWTGKPFAVEVKNVSPNAGGGAAALIQSLETGHILGAARLAPGG